MNTSWPSVSRIAGAVVAAAAAAALPTLLVGVFALLAYPFAFIAALFHAALIGLPVYLLLRRRMRFTWGVAVVAGFAIGALPAAGYSLLDGDVVAYDLVAMALLGLCGAFGGAAFRGVVGDGQPAPAFDPAIWE